MGSQSPLLRELIGAELRRARVAQGRSLRELAAATNISLGYLSEIERGLKEPSSEFVLVVLRELRLSLAGLLGRVSASAQLAESARPLVALAEPSADVTEIAA